MKDKERINSLLKRRIKNEFKKCLSSRNEKKGVRKKGVRLFFKTLKKLDSPGLRFGKLNEEISFKRTAVSIDIYSLTPIYERGLIESLLEKKVSLILDMKDLSFKIRTTGKEIPLMEIKNTKKKELIRQIKATYKNIEYINCW